MCQSLACCDVSTCYIRLDLTNLPNNKHLTINCLLFYSILAPFSIHIMLCVKFINFHKSLWNTSYRLQRSSVCVSLIALILTMAGRCAHIQHTNLIIIVAVDHLLSNDGKPLAKYCLQSCIHFFQIPLCISFFIWKNIWLIRIQGKKWSNRYPMISWFFENEIIPAGWHHMRDIFDQHWFS